jgi:ATP-dependent Lon protease
MSSSTKKSPAEVLTSVSSIDDPSRLADTIAAHMALKLDSKAKVLEIQNFDVSASSI